MAECALIVPLYRNAGNVPALLERLAQIHAAVPGGVEAVCVVDGSPDDCHALLAAALPRMPFASRLLLLSRNFGSFPAIRAALATGKLDDAEKLLNAGREKAQGLELAELTGLAGDHAAALGRLSNAKWLWRLALKRFGELGAMDTPAAKAVAENLRVTG